MRLSIFYSLMMTLLCSTLSAEWIHPITNPEVAVDSINRFLVVRDTTIEKVFGKQILSVGDVSGDGISDVLICRNEGPQNITNLAFLFHGGVNPDSIFNSEYNNFKWNINSINDINNDGFTDFGFGLPDNSYTFHFGGPLFDDSSDFTIPNIWSRATIASDIDGDGNIEIALTSDPNGGFVYIYAIDSLRDTIPKYIIPDTSAEFGNNITVGEFNGDSYFDIAVAAYLGLDTSTIKFYWGGVDFDTIPDLIIKSTKTRFGKTMVPIDDFNGDGYGDIFIGGTTDIEPYGIYYGGPNIDDKLDIILNISRQGGYYAIHSIDAGGDVNNDGYTDLLIGYSLFSGRDELHIYLGGPTTDTMRLSDVYIENLMMENNQAFFGDEVAGIGDFNGDGIDDFAVRSQTAGGGTGWWGEVNFFAGWNSNPTDIEYEYEPNLPDNFTLSQNYPNPFNPSTTIEFQLPQREHVTLSIYNSLSQRVKILINKELSVGSYKIEWDGKNEGGQPVSSGVYLYKLEMNKISVSKKMVVLK